MMVLFLFFSCSSEDKPTSQNNNSIQDSGIDDTQDTEDTSDTQDTEDTQDNSLPTVTAEASITPNEAVYLDSELQCIASFTDPEDGVLTPSYIWTVDGNAIGEASLIQLSTQLVSVGSDLTCTATAEDSEGESITSSATVRIQNRAPALNSIALTPSSIILTDTVTCTASSSDPDQDNVVQSFLWRNITSNTEYIPSYSDNNQSVLALSSYTPSALDEIECQVTATDAHGESVTQSSSIIISNSLPEFTNLPLILPSIATTGTTLSCSATASDLEDPNPQISYEWQIQGNVVSTSDSFTPVASNSNVGDDIECHATATDIQGGTTTEVSSITLSNSPPSLASLTLTPSSPTSQETLNCEATATDIDDDSLTLSFSWVNLTTGSSYTSSSTTSTSAELDLNQVAIMPDEVIQCMAMATDVHGATSTDSIQSTVLNSPPTIASPTSITPNSGVTTTTSLTCTVSFTDADDGPLSNQFAWRNVNTNTVLGAGPTTTLTNSNTSGGDIIECRAWTSDSSGAYIESIDTVQVENNPPSITNILIDPDPVTLGSFPTCTATVVDIDEALSATYEWYVDGGYAGSGNPLDLSQTAAIIGSSIECLASVTDSQGASDSQSLSTTVVNGGPVLSSISITPSTPVEGIDDLLCEATGYDPDGDSTTITYTWMDPFGNSYAGDTIQASQTLGGQTWTCTAEISDGSLSNTDSTSVAIDFPPDCVFGSCDEFVELGGSIVIDFKYIPKGDDPLGEYRLTQNMMMMTTEVTQGMFNTLMGYDSRDGSTTDKGDGDNFPAYHSNWHMAADFANALTNHYNNANGTSLSECYTCTGSGTAVDCVEAMNPYDCHGFSIPTAAVYEYTARSGTTKPFWTGQGDNLGGDISYTSCPHPSGADTSVVIQDGVNNPPVSNYAWWCGNYLDPTYQATTKPVALKQPNGFGIYDTIGNVYEWTTDWSGSFPASNLDPWTSQSGATRVWRGGGFNSSFPGLSISGVSNADPISRFSYAGFRVVRYLPYEGPSTPEISILPTVAQAGVDDLLCNIDVPSTSPNQDPFTYHFVWTVDGTAYTGPILDTVYAGDSVPGSETLNGETWSCTVTASNSFDISFSVSTDTVVTGDPNCVYGPCDSAVVLGNGYVMDFNLIPAGDDPLGRYAITQDFYMLTTEVTQGMYTELMGYDSRDGQSTSYGDGGEYPTYFANWHMAADFANTLTAYHNSINGTGLGECYTCTDSGTTAVFCTEALSPYDCDGYTIPTEYEWEYAGRSGTSGNFWTGEGVNLGGDLSSYSCGNTINDTATRITDGATEPPLSDFAWWCGNRLDPTDTDTSKPVALKRPNGFGLYDMHANLSEWTADWWGSSSISSTDPWHSTPSTHRTCRGGAWNSTSPYVRITTRSNCDPSVRSQMTGFRVRRLAP